MHNSMAVLTIVALLATGCGWTPSPSTNLADAKPELDLLRLGFDHSGCTIDTHVDDCILVFTDGWFVEIRPISGLSLQNAESALRGVIRSGGPTYRSDSLEIPALNATLYRYLRGIENDHLVAQGDYLLDIDGHWLLACVLPRKLELFDQNAVDRFFFSFELFDKPRADVAVPPAWKEYQQNRADNSPIAKFFLYMDPAPINLGSYSRYLDLVKSRTFLSFTSSEFSSGGRMIGKEILEFYSKDDPTYVRVDVWNGRKPPSEPTIEKIYSDTLTVTSSTISIWSFDKPYSFALDPGVYDVDIVLVNRGKYKTESLPERELFERADLERYEIYLNTRKDE